MVEKAVKALIEEKKEPREGVGEGALQRADGARARISPRRRWM
jgi:hypothetical protein